MKRLTIGICALALVAIAGAAIVHAARVGEAAPAFTATDTHGKAYNLADYKGKWVVLEWHNQGCPYVKKHYESGNMQKLQQEWTSKGVVWLTVISSAPGTQGYVTGPQADAYVAEKQAHPTAVLLDPEGTLGHLYEAKTTPHMFVINPAGMLIYNGAIDDKPTTDRADVDTATNYVSAALKEGMAGQPVATPTSRPYGCSVKYANPGQSH
jgi:peroxiredoxin